MIRRVGRGYAREVTESWLDRPTTPRAGEELDLGRLSEYLSSVLGLEGEVEISQYPRGFSNLTYSVRAGDRELVLRRPPFGASIRSAHDMGREYRILSALSTAYPKAPATVGYCDDEAVLGAPFYLMERVEGVILRADMPPSMNPDPPLMKGISQAWVATLAELHAVDYAAAGLGELGRPAGYIGRQVEGWAKRYRAAATDDVASLDLTAAWLADHLPPEGTAALIHNDFKYDNVVLDSRDWARILAVLDWEMATLGDPLMDLGTSLGYWVDAEDPPELRELKLSPTTLAGNPSRTEVCQGYAVASGRDVGNPVFYYVFGLFKIAVIVQQIYRRFRLGLTADDRFAHLDRAVSSCGRTAQQAILRDRIDRLYD